MDDDNSARPFPPQELQRSAACDNWNHPQAAAASRPSDQYGEQQYGPTPWVPSALHDPDTFVPPALAKSRLPVILVAVAVVLALVAGFAVWLVANRDTASSSGQSTPHAAVTGLLGSASRQDSVGAAWRNTPAS